MRWPVVTIHAIHYTDFFIIGLRNIYCGVGALKNLYFSSVKIRITNPGNLFFRTPGRQILDFYVLADVPVDSFHQAQGFSEIGSAEILGGEKTVRYLMRAV